MAGFCDALCCKLPARVAVVSGARFISLQCGHHGLVTARQLLAAGRIVRVDAWLPTKVNANVCSDGAYFASDVDATQHQRSLDQQVIAFAARLDRLAHSTHDARSAGGDLAS